MALAQYQLTNLVSNQVRQAQHDDPLLVNGWGLVHPPGGPFWISDNNSGWSTLYAHGGAKQGLVVEIPTANGAGPGSPTGIVFNGSPDATEFQVQGRASIFLFATLDGTISGWAPQSDRNNAIIAVDKSKSGAVYTGLAITNKATANFLFAADQANNKVDIYNDHFKLVKSLPTLRFHRASPLSASGTSMVCSMLHLRAHPGLRAVLLTSLTKTEPT